MEQDIKALRQQFEQDYQQAKDAQDVEQLRIKYLGRKSAIAGLMAKIPSLPPHQKAQWGKILNVLKQEFTERIQAKKQECQDYDEQMDLTFPAQSLHCGTEHIISTVAKEICLIFEKLGFTTIEGTEVEDEWHNFSALNFPENHPSRDDFDTFYLNLPELKNGRPLLRCHTSPSQIRVMQNNQPPLAVISPGRVYRPDEVDATHSFMFYQIEGFVVNHDINFGHLKGVLLHFAQNFFGPNANLRFRPHFFPFTEPSAEVDVSCIICQTKTSDERRATSDERCSVCKGKGWLEVLGCGMIHPNVLEACTIDSKKYQGFAFGLGIERMAMLKYGINDIRLFTENDIRFLTQF